MSVLFPIALFSSELFLGFFPLAEALFFVLLLILFVMLPVVYLSEKYIHQRILRWIICVTSFLCVIIGNISYVTCLIFT